MSDLIEREALLTALRKESEECEDAGVSPSFWTALRIVKEQPTVQEPEEVCEWERTKYRYDVLIAHNKANFESDLMDWKVCPYCGGKLKIKGGE